MYIRILSKQENTNYSVQILSQLDCYKTEMSPQALKEMIFNNEILFNIENFINNEFTVEEITKLYNTNIAVRENDQFNVDTYQDMYLNRDLLDYDYSCKIAKDIAKSYNIFFEWQVVEDLNRCTSLGEQLGYLDNVVFRNLNIVYDQWVEQKSDFDKYFRGKLKKKEYEDEIFMTNYAAKVWYNNTFNLNKDRRESIINKILQYNKRY